MFKDTIEILQKMKTLGKELENQALLIKRQAEASKLLAKALKQMADAYKL